MSQQQETIGQPRLSRDEFSKIATAYGRLLDLKATKIQTTNHEAEIKGLVEYLAEVFIAHAGEFLGVWTAIRDEYEPLLNVLSRAAERVAAISAQRQAMVQAFSAPAAPVPENVTPLIQP
jgi:hypothetical protein